MRSGHVEIFVTDAKRAREFYVDVLGLELLDTPPGSGTWLRSGDTEILLRPGRTAAPAADYARAAVAIVFYTEDLDGTVRELRARGLEFRGTDGSDRCLTFADPDGNWFQLVDPADH